MLTPVRYAALTAAALWLACSPESGRAEVDQGSVRNVPWSGSYWPIRYGQLIEGPLRKYDRVTGRRAAVWEMQQNPPTPDVPEWFGYCHAWAASAVLDREPTQMRQTRAVDGMPVSLGVGDQKGMLTACHTDDVAQHHGVRFQGEAGEDPNDIYPDELWRVLKLYIKQRGVPLIVDIEGGTEVWNYPVYAYRVDYRPDGSSGRYFAEMSLWMADDAVPADMVGVQVSKQTYYFTFQMQGGAAVLGSGRWVEPSVAAHPDFAWYPYIVRSENPEMRYEEVKRLVGAATDSAPPPVTPPATSVSSALPPNLSPGLMARPGLPPNVVPTTPTVATGTQASSAAPQPYFLSPLELLALLANKTSHFPIDATVDKFDGGHYGQGEPFTVSGSIGADGYLYLLYLDSQGQVTVLFPRMGDSNLVSANRRFSFPRAAAGHTFRTTGPPGTHRIKVVVTRRPLLFSGLAMWPRGSLPRDLPPQRLLLPPSQKAKFKHVLNGDPGAPSRAVQGSGTQRFDNVSPRNFLGDFGQDEVAIYVGPVD